MSDSGNNGNGEEFSQHPFVDKLRPEPSAPPSQVLVLEGLGGNSDREGWVRLYFNRPLTYYAEFRREDIVFSESISAEQSPLAGLKATRVGIRLDAIIEYTRTTRARPRDEFDLDVRLSAARGRAAQPLAPVAPEAPVTLEDVCTGTLICPTDVCQTKFTCVGPVCENPSHTCHTNCICPTDHTCRTQCGQPRTQCGTCQTCQTCQTCPTQCGTCQTCQTCPTQCGHTCQTCDPTCGTCDTCNPHACGPR